MKNHSRTIAIVWLAAAGLLTATLSLKAAETNYAAANGSVIYENSAYNNNALFKTSFDPFQGQRTQRAIAEFAVSSLGTNLQSVRLIITVAGVNGLVSNYAYNIYAYTNANGTINNDDYGCDAAFIGTVCSNVTPSVGEKFTNDVTAAVMNAITSGCAYVGFRIRPHIDPVVFIRTEVC